MNSRRWLAKMIAEEEEEKPWPRPKTHIIENELKIFRVQPTTP
jgi:hypothetical protein